MMLKPVQRILCASLLGIAALGAAGQALAHDRDYGYDHHRHEHWRPAPPPPPRWGHGPHYYREGWYPAPVVIERPVVYRERSYYYAPPPPPRYYAPPPGITIGVSVPPIIIPFR
ncbi:hypothetical protein [Niveibacterium sp. SC-1]|uniref:hypothetical protein n=1 Tax=Niveibacterium sp. SC-1 TaxID=3135646 RepID=UPI00311D87B5